MSSDLDDFVWRYVIINQLTSLTRLLWQLGGITRGNEAYTLKQYSFDSPITTKEKRVGILILEKKKREGIPEWREAQTNAGDCCRETGKATVESFARSNSSVLKLASCVTFFSESLEPIFIFPWTSSSTAWKSTIISIFRSTVGLSQSLIMTSCNL